MCTQWGETTCKQRKSGFGNFGRGWQRSWKHPGRSPLLAMEKRWDITSLPAQARMPRMWRLYGQQRNNSTRFSRRVELLKTNWSTISRKRAVAVGRSAPEMVIPDANILIRAVLGKRVREILETHSARVRFCAR